MSGYNYSEWKSNNYVEAESNDNILKGGEAVKYLKKHYKIIISAKQIKERMMYAEWHHASKMYTKVYFYSVENLDKFGAENHGKNFKDEENEVNKENEGKDVVAIFEEWEKITINRFGKKGWKKEEKEYKGVVKGAWLHLENGSKKSLNSKGFLSIKCQL